MSTQSQKQITPNTEQHCSLTLLSPARSLDGHIVFKEKLDKGTVPNVLFCAVIYKVEKSATIYLKYTVYNFCAMITLGKEALLGVVN